MTDGFKGLEEIINQAYPLKAKQQRCLIHISQEIWLVKVKRADRAVILEQFKTIYRAENLEMAVQIFRELYRHGNQSIGKSWKVWRIRIIF